MATTTNYGWTTPDDTALVKDGASAIRTLGSSIDTTLKAQIDAQIPDSIIDAKGDLIVGTADNTPARLASSATNGQVLTVDTSTSTGLKWAPASSLTWTQRNNPASSNGLNEIAYNGSSLYIAVGLNGVLYTSPDALTWTSRTSGFGTNEIRGIAFGNGLWVAVGDNGTITTSTDGITWTARTSNMSTNAINNVIYANSTWVAVGQGGGTTNTGGITYSTDGITWTRKSQSLTVGATYNKVVWNGTNYVIGATVSTNNSLYASTAAGTWTASASGSGSEIRDLIWDGTRHIYTSGSGSSYYYYFNSSVTLASANNVGGNLNANGSASNRVRMLYSGQIYEASSILMAYTPVSTAPGIPTNATTIGLTGSNAINNSGLANLTTTLYVGASGYILGDQIGRIFTSF